MDKKNTQILLLVLIVVFSGGCSTASIEDPTSSTNSQVLSPPPVTIDYSPDLEIRELIVTETSISFTVCYSLPSSDNSWVLGRLPDDVYISDEIQFVSLQSFSLVGFEEQSDSTTRTRCDRTKANLPTNFQIDQAALTVERIAAAIPEEIDWDNILQQVEMVAPGLEIEPILDQPGPGFAVVNTPTGMTALEAHNLVIGMIEPVFIGPWSLSISIDLK